MEMAFMGIYGNGKKAINKRLRKLLKTRLIYNTRIYGDEHLWKLTISVNPKHMKSLNKMAIFIYGFFYP
jgi:hypothetical protein